MTTFTIKGGKPLRGEVILSGAKNLASKLILASLLTAEECVIENVPDIGESEIALTIASLAGATTRHEGTRVYISADAIINADILGAPRNRLSVLAVGPLLFRCGEAIVPLPGGDQIGQRPINFHVSALEALGAIVTQNDSAVSVKAPRGLQGALIELPFPSVGATETILLNSSWAAGKSVLTNAAIEPEILELVHFLNSMGARITRSATRTFEIQGVKSFHGARQHVISDRLEAVSYASTALATRGDILIHGAIAEHLRTYITFVKAMGGRVEEMGKSIRFSAEGKLKSAHIRTAVYPGFATDWQQPSAVVLVTATGMSTIHETVYEQRLGYVRELNRMGAAIKTQNTCLRPPCRYDGKGFEHVAIIHGPSQLRGATIKIPDIRAGMAHVIAALVANGVSQLSGVEHLDRGYGSQLETKLRGIGATITRNE